MRLKNNIVIEWLKHLCKICVSQFTIKQFNSFKRNLNENYAKPEEYLTFSFRGKKFFNITHKTVLKFQHEFLHLIQEKMDMRVSGVSKSLPNLFQCLNKTLVNSVS